MPEAVWQESASSEQVGAEESLYSQQEEVAKAQKEFKLLEIGHLQAQAWYEDWVDSKQTAGTKGAGFESSAAFMCLLGITGGRV